MEDSEVQGEDGDTIGTMLLDDFIVITLVLMLCNLMQ